MAILYFAAYLALMSGLLALGWTVHQRYYVCKVKPHKLTITEYQTGTLISYRWIHSWNYWYVTCVICVFIIMANMLIVRWIRGFNDSWTSVLALTVFALVFGYDSIMGFINKTTLFLNNQQQIILLHGPLPGFRDPHRGVTSVLDFQYRIDNRVTRRFGPLITYPVYAVTSSGSSIRLLQEIDSEDAAIAIVNALRSRLENTSIRTNHRVNQSSFRSTTKGEHLVYHTK